LRIFGEPFWYRFRPGDYRKGDKMSKQRRGKALWSLPSKGRGTCPVCGRTRVKILYDLVCADGIKKKVCKQCQNKKK
jgi:hypothetical protein